MQVRLTRASLLLLSVLLGACSSAPPVGEAALELGTGTWRFEAIEDGAELPLVRGAQGGWHMWLSVRTQSLDAEVGSLELIVEPDDASAPPQRVSVGVRLDPPDAEGRRAYLGWAAIMADPSCAVGRLYRVQATFTDSSGRRVSTERFVTPTEGENPPPVCGVN